MLTDLMGPAVGLHPVHDTDHADPDHVTSAVTCAECSKHEHVAAAAVAQYAVICHVSPLSGSARV